MKLHQVTAMPNKKIEDMEQIASQRHGVMTAIVHEHLPHVGKGTHAVEYHSWYHPKNSTHVELEHHRGAGWNAKVKHTVGEGKAGESTFKVSTFHTSPQTALKIALKNHLKIKNAMK